jgi:hypothetical protein
MVRMVLRDLLGLEVILDLEVPMEIMVLAIQIKARAPRAYLIAVI